jgi:hypothetical protein
MRLAAGFIGKSIENGEGRGSETNAEPGNRRRFGLDNRQTALEKVRNFGLLARLRFKPDKQCDIDLRRAPAASLSKNLRGGRKSRRFMIFSFRR